MDGLPTKEEIENLIKEGVIKPQIIQSNTIEICKETNEECCGSSTCTCSSDKIENIVSDMKFSDTEDDSEFYKALKNQVDEDEFEDDDIEDDDIEDDDIEDDDIEDDDIEDEESNLKDDGIGVLTPHCEKCSKIINESCSVYANPAIMMRWVDGKSNMGCSFNRHNLVKVDDKKSKEKVRVGQQKQKSKSKK